MEMKDIIAKVNYFSKLARERELTEAEKEEREKYRKLYLEQFKAQVRGHLDRIKIVDGEVENNGNNKIKII
ncbi:DUF896 domain-containing protein [uncultured Fusobacterium sp.]|jgi:uncharacterized protein YnzC (UPF0291/DUF896 family)|uniref:DUF896 domain-containing protein n=3 Tax=Fusobacterium TaxID=848 RepID=A0A9E2NWU0_9FUSO|nr:DUF896 domain-containing protein [uncultured Fusobacterium sp.]MBM6690119.1 DUF896 domain-containing protein [Fusobacterium mortiferum]MBU3841945.1 DUF896 domain-containing protein [Candidatus Fusobacterium pullicola]